MNKDDECAICLDTIEEYDYAILSCKHMFHYKCLRSWLQTKKEYVKLCPLCDNPGEIENIITVEKPKISTKDNLAIHSFYFSVEESYEPVCCCNNL